MVRRIRFAPAPDTATLRIVVSSNRRILAASITLLMGCSYYDSSLLAPNSSGPDDAGSDRSLDAPVESTADGDVDAPADTSTDARDASEDTYAPDTGEAQTCSHVRPPDPPAVTDAGGDIDFVVATSSVDFGDVSGDPGQFGYDLDFRCTCQGEGDSCLRESWASANACDGPDGRDNQAGVFISTMSQLFGDFGSASWTQGATEGDWSLLLRVRDYNGQPDDDQVELDWYVADQYWEDKPDKSHVPAWDGSDTWPIRKTSLAPDAWGQVDIESPLYFDEHAYVNGGVLVGSLNETELQLGAEYSIEMIGAFITARIEEGPLGWTLTEGVLASRWKLNTLLGQISRIELLGMPVCTNHPAYSSVKDQVCAFADIYSGVGAPTTPCDSISMGMAFETVPAGFGAIVDEGSDPPPCDPSVDPSQDSCGS